MSPSDLKEIKERLWLHPNKGAKHLVQEDAPEAITLGMLSEPLPPRRRSKNALRYVGYY